MIPKVIHYCWFGKNELPQKAQKCIDSWKKYCPEYEVKRWDEDNFNLKCSTFVKEAYEMKKWAFVSDFARLKIIYDEGGIYLDVDVELIKNMDDLLKNESFFGEESSGYINTGLGFGAEKNNKIVLKLMEEYKNKHFVLPNGNLDTVPCPQKNTRPLRKMGYSCCENKIWKKDGVTVYPFDYFCPIDYKTGILKITEHTYSIHHFSAMWHSKLDKIILNLDSKSITDFNIEFRIRRLLSLPLRIVNKINNIGIKKSVLLFYSKIKHRN